ncbi:MAG: hypothetical protein KDD89_00105 [Anaerolineales bacterium]|nr:hypothetical protein [Anaerolineales bacterium]
MSIIENEARQKWQRLERDVSDLLSRGSALPVFRASLTLPLTQAGITAVLGSISEVPSGYQAFLLNTGGAGEVFIISAIDGSWRSWQGTTP